MLWGGVAHGGALELRSANDGGVRLSGRFPYGVETQLSRRHREVFSPRAFSSRIDAGEDVHFLIGHDFDRPLASRKAGTLEVRDGNDELSFEAQIGAELRSVPYVQDFLGALDARLLRGLSPGFRVHETPGAVETRADGDSMLRTVHRAELFELSAVTLPAYPEAQIEARAWMPSRVLPVRPGQRWRA